MTDTANKSNKPNKPEASYNEASLIQYLDRLHGISISASNHLITVNRHLGLRLLGKIDYLVNHCGYGVSRRVQ